jgi:heme/copper-type cytochrome/quinol oxidase subunit 2
MMFFAAGVGSGLANDVIDKFPGTLRLIIGIGASALVALMVHQNWADYMENSAWLVLLVFITITMTVVVCVVKLKRRRRMVPASA